jgi:glycosyltransferase involved in cell wall biosynthesis
LRILFAVPGVHIPHVATGGNMDLHEMALAVGALGHEVAVAAALPGKAHSAAVRQVPYRIRQLGDRSHLLVFRDTDNGYATYRVGSWLVPRLVADRIRDWCPDVVVVQGYRAWNLAVAAVQQGQPVVMRLIDRFGIQDFAQAVAADPVVAALLTNRLFSVVCNSRFTAAEFERELGCAAPVIYPTIRPPAVAGLEIRPRYVTFISPVPDKGLSVALEVARLLPHREFLFVDGWWAARREIRKLGRELSRLPNVTWRESSIGLDDVFRLTGVILMPSQVQEAFGRVIVEAGYHGIPAVASRVGGIPEAIGDSGILLDTHSTAAHWAEAIDDARADGHRYGSLRAGALANAAREEFEVSAITRRLLDVLSDHLSRSGVCSQIPGDVRIGREVGTKRGPSEL